MLFRQFLAQFEYFNVNCTATAGQNKSCLDHNDSCGPFGDKACCEPYHCDDDWWQCKRNYDMGISNPIKDFMYCGNEF